MQIERFVLNAFSTNCYVLYDGGKRWWLIRGQSRRRFWSF